MNKPELVQQNGKWIRTFLDIPTNERLSEIKRHLMFKKNKDIFDYEMQSMVITKGIQAYEKELGINKPQPVAQP